MNGPEKDPVGKILYLESKRRLFNPKISLNGHQNIEGSEPVKVVDRWGCSGKIIRSTFLFIPPAMVAYGIFSHDKRLVNIGATASVAEGAYIGALAFKEYFNNLIITCHNQGYINE